MITVHNTIKNIMKKEKTQERKIYIKIARITCILQTKRVVIIGANDPILLEVCQYPLTRGTTKNKLK